MVPLKSGFLANKLMDIICFGSESCKRYEEGRRNRKVDAKNDMYVSDMSGMLIRKIIFCSASAVFDSSLRACTCTAGFQFLSNGSCQACPVGTESSADKSSCVPCAPGKYLVIMASVPIVRWARSPILSLQVCAMSTRRIMYCHCAYL